MTKRGVVSKAEGREPGAEPIAWLGDLSQGAECQARARRNFTKFSHPHLSRLMKTQPGRSVVARGTTAGQGGEWADSRLGDRAGGRQLGMQGWREGRGQPSLPAGFLGGGALARALPQGIFVVAAAAPAPDVPAANAAHARDAATATGHVAAAHGAGPEAIAAAAAGAADDSCRGTPGAEPSGAGLGEAAALPGLRGSWNNGLGARPAAPPPPLGKIAQRPLPPCPALAMPPLDPV